MLAMLMQAVHGNMKHKKVASLKTIKDNQINQIQKPLKLYNFYYKI